MRRGLKDRSDRRVDPRRRRHSRRRFPDEEGTESCRQAGQDGSRNIAVAEDSPMRRGLKGLTLPGGSPYPFRVAEDSPMRRGLKASLRNRLAADEKCRRRFPDEEGTERTSRNHHTTCDQAQVAEDSPMRRGLKAINVIPIGPDEEGTERMASQTDSILVRIVKSQKIPR